MRKVTHFYRQVQHMKLTPAQAAVLREICWCHDNGVRFCNERCGNVTKLNISTVERAYAYLKRTGAIWTTGRRRRRETHLPKLFWERLGAEKTPHSDGYDVIETPEKTPHSAGTKTLKEKTPFSDDPEWHDFEPCGPWEIH